MILLIRAKVVVVAICAGGVLLATDAAPQAAVGFKPLDMRALQGSVVRAPTLLVANEPNCDRAAATKIRREASTPL